MTITSTTINVQTLKNLNDRLSDLFHEKGFLKIVIKKGNASASVFNTRHSHQMTILVLKGYQRLNEVRALDFIFLIEVKKSFITFVFINAK